SCNVIEKAQRFEPLSEEDRDNLAIFVAFLWNRVPDFEQSVNKVHEHGARMIADAAFRDVATAERELARFSKETQNEPTVSAKDLVEFHKTGAFKIEVH